MNILLIKTDQPKAELYIYKDKQLVESLVWQADRQLSVELNRQVNAILNTVKLNLNDLNSIGIFSGPGSFTGLRIGHSVANALAYSYNIPIVGASSKSWQTKAVKQLLEGKNDRIAVPKYGAPVHITQPKK